MTHIIFALLALFPISPHRVLTPGARDVGAVVIRGHSTSLVISAQGIDCGQGPYPTSETGGAYVAIFTTGVVGAGFKFRVPASPTQRVLRLYLDQWSCDAQMRAQLTDGSASPVATTLNGSASGSANRKWTITYNSALGGELLVDFRITNNLGSNPNVGVRCITLGVV